MTPVRLGLIGLGNWGERLAETLAGIETTELVACFARSPDRREAFAAAHGCRPAPSLEALLAGEDLDGVVIATPHSTHEHLVVAAAEAGKHVMVEKPLTLTVESARRCVAVAERAGVTLQVAHYRRRLGATRRLRALIDAGELGTLHHVEGRFYRPWGPDTKRRWRDDPSEAPAGAMTALGVHLVDNLHYLAGPVSRLAAFSKQIEAPTALDDVTDVLLEFESGCVGTLSTSLRLPFEATTAAYGSEASAWSEADGGRFFVQPRDAEHRTEQPVERGDGIGLNLAAFADSIRSGAAPETGGAEGLAVVIVMDAIQRSAAAGGAVTEVV